jgi:hypothetical protein
MAQFCRNGERLTVDLHFKSATGRTMKAIKAFEFHETFTTKLPKFARECNQATDLFFSFNFLLF